MMHLIKTYLESCGINTSITEYFGKLYDDHDWQALESVDTRELCAICMIKKRPKVRHVKNVSLI